MLGVIGGMGPAATADFFAKLIEETPATCDEDHVPTLIVSESSTEDTLSLNTRTKGLLRSTILSHMTQHLVAK